MKILYLLTREPEGAGAALLREHAREHTVLVLDLRAEPDYERVVDAVASSDRVICW